MKINQSEPGVTLIQDRPWFLPGFCLMFFCIGLYLLIERTVRWNWDQNTLVGVLLCLLLGGGMFVYAWRMADYRFDCTSRRLTWSIRNLLGRQEGALEFDQIERVVLHRGPDYDDTTYRVVLYAPQQFPLSNAFTCNKSQLERVVTAIESALTAPGR